MTLLMDRPTVVPTRIADIRRRETTKQDDDGASVPILSKAEIVREINEKADPLLQVPTYLQMAKILVFSKDQTVGDLFREERVAMVSSSADPREAYQNFFRNRYDISVIHTSMEKEELDLIARIYQAGNRYFILAILGVDRGHGWEDDDIDNAIVKLLEIGADRVALAPISRRLLIASVSAMARRIFQPPKNVPDILFDEYGKLEINITTHEVMLNNRSVHFSPTEFRLLALLVSNKGRVSAYNEIFNCVWPEGRSNDSLKWYIRVIRKKIMEYGNANKDPIENFRDEGYCFVGLGLQEKKFCSSASLT